MNNFKVVIIENNLNIAYHFNDLSKSFVITANGNENLNSILKKTFTEPIERREEI